MTRVKQAFYHKDPRNSALPPYICEELGVVMLGHTVSLTDLTTEPLGLL